MGENAEKMNEGRYVFEELVSRGVSTMKLALEKEIDRRSLSGDHKGKDDKFARSVKENRREERFGREGTSTGKCKRWS